MHVLLRYYIISQSEFDTTFESASNLILFINYKMLSQFIIWQNI